MKIKNRRSFLTKSMIVGAASGFVSIPSKWSRPVVDSIILPAHAQTSSAVIANPSSLDFGIVPSNGREFDAQSSFELTFPPSVPFPQFEFEITNSNFRIDSTQTSGNRVGIIIVFDCNQVGIETGEFILTVFDSNGSVTQRIVIPLIASCQNLSVDAPSMLDLGNVITTSFPPDPVAIPLTLTNTSNIDLYVLDIFDPTFDLTADAFFSLAEETVLIPANTTVTFDFLIEDQNFEALNRPFDESFRILVGTQDDLPSRGLSGNRAFIEIPLVRVTGNWVHN